MDENKDGKAKPQAKSKSYYRTIAGKKYDRELLETAEKLAAYVTDGKLTPDAARKLMEDSKDSGKVTAIEKATLAYIKDKYDWSKPPAAEAKSAGAKAEPKPKATAKKVAQPKAEAKAKVKEPAADTSEAEPQAEKATAEPAQDVKVESSAQMAMSIVNKHALYAAGAGLIPIPIVDLASIAGIQVNMMRELAHHYDDTYVNHVGKNSLGVIIGTLTAQGMSTPIAGLLKAIPLVGSLLGAASMSVSAGAATTALGGVFVRHYEYGGNFLTFDAKAAREDYRNAFKTGS